MIMKEQKMIGNQMKVSRLMVKLLIISSVLFFSCKKNEISETQINGILINKANCNGKNLIFEIDGRKYDFFIDSSDDENYLRLFITVKDNNQNIYHLASTFAENEIITGSEKNEYGFSMRYNLESKDMKLYHLPLTEDQLETEICDDGILVLPPEF
ncbi:MAG: hypothetical protein J6Y36_03200 [Treponema sp.]|nr:hypothetical protein [Treponema sp.]